VVNLLTWPSGVLAAGKAERGGDAEFGKEGVVFEPFCKCLCRASGG